MTDDVALPMYKGGNLPPMYHNARITDQPWSKHDKDMLKSMILAREYIQEGRPQHLVLLHEDNTNAYRMTKTAYYILARSLILNSSVSYITSVAELDAAIIGEYESYVDDCKINYYFVDDFIFCDKEQININKIHVFMRRCLANNQALCFTTDNHGWALEENWVWPRYMMSDIVGSSIVLPLDSIEVGTPVVRP